MDLILLLTFSLNSISFGLPSNLLSSICYIESNHNPNKIHFNDGNGNSVGICQVKFKTAKWLGFKGSEKELMDSKVNIYYAALYLRYHIKRYHGDVSKAIIAYNMGHAKGLTHTSYSDKVIRQWRTTQNERR